MQLRKELGIYVNSLLFPWYLLIIVIMIMTKYYYYYRYISEFKFKCIL